MKSLANKDLEINDRNNQQNKFGEVIHRRHGFDADEDSDEEEEEGAKKKSKQGAIIGVYFPCIQSILGIILFLRLPSITGQAGYFIT